MLSHLRKQRTNFCIPFFFLIIDHYSERNREHAKKCRFRKKNYLKSLEESVLELKQENDKLRRMVMTRYTKDEITSMGREPSEQLATGLKKSNCKATTKSAESYLQSLRDECKMDNET